MAAHKLSLARELLDDIELSRLGPEQLLLKASRLARLLEDDQARTWIDLELRGYHDDEVGRQYMSVFGRWIDERTRSAYWLPLASLGAWAGAMQMEIQQLRIPDVSVSLSSANPNEIVGGWAGSNLARASTPVNVILERLQHRTTAVAQLRQIQSRVLAEIHTFVVQTYHRLAFTRVAESLFEQHQRLVDDLLRANATDVLEKIPSISARLTEGDAEALSQALNSCRRMIKALADEVQPPMDGDVKVDGETYSIGSDKVLNRIQYFLAQKCSSKKRRERLIKNLRALWDRTSAGVHADVAPDEARALFLQCYLTLGEVLSATTLGSAVPAITTPTNGG